MKKIFITIPWFLPAFRAGGPIQSIANLVKEFDKDVAYFIFCGDTDLNGAALEGIITGEWIPYNNCSKVWYSDHRKTSDSLVKQVEHIKPDVLYIIGIFSWHFNMVPLLFCKVPRKIVSVRGMLHPGALSQKKLKKKIYLGVFKLLEYHHKVAFHATDEAEAKYIRKYFGDVATIFTAGNFPNNTGLQPIVAKDGGRLHLLSIALISPMKNILLVLQALKKITASIQYDIYGPVKDYDYWELCKQQIKDLPGNVTVTYHGETSPQNVREILSGSHVFILPSKSENFGHAVFEALSAGRPVITSYNTPWNGLQEANAGMNVSVDGLDEMIHAIDFFAEMGEVDFLKWHEGAVGYAKNAIDMAATRHGYKRMFLGE